MADAGGFDHWRGGELAPLPAQGVATGTFDYWRGGELLLVHSEAPTVSVIGLTSPLPPYRPLR